MRVDSGVIALFAVAAVGAAAWWHDGWLVAVVFAILTVIFAGLFQPRFSLSFVIRHRSGSSRVHHGESQNFVASNAIRHAEPRVPRLLRGAVGVSRAWIVTCTLVVHTRWIWRLLLFAMAWLLTGVAVRVAFDLWFLAQQRRRDRLARRTLDTIRAGGEPRRPFFLYLRPFRITGAMRSVARAEFELAQEQRHPVTMTSPDGKDTAIEIPVFTMNVRDPMSESAGELNPEWESIFERGLHRFGDLIALGRPGEAYGSGRLATTDEEWRDVLRVLLPHARGCLVVPSAIGSTRWEIDLLRERDGFRDAFVLLPTLDGKRNTPAIWDETRRALADTLPLPEHPILPALVAYDAAMRTHITLLTPHRWSAAGKTRVFVNPEEFEAAVERLLPVASRAAGTDWDGVLKSAALILENLGDEEALARMGLQSAPGATRANGRLSDVVRIDEIWHASRQQTDLVQLSYYATYAEKRMVVKMNVLPLRDRCSVEELVCISQDDFDRAMSEARQRLWGAIGGASA